MTDLDALPLSPAAKGELTEARVRLNQRATQIRQELQGRYQERFREQVRIAQEGGAANPEEQATLKLESFSEELNADADMRCSALQQEWRQMLERHLPPGTLGDGGPDDGPDLSDSIDTDSAPSDQHDPSPPRKEKLPATPRPAAAPPVQDLTPSLERDVSRLPPEVRAYQQSHPHWFDPSRLAQEWHAGYLPEGRATIPEHLQALTNTIIFPLRDQAGQLLGYAGRDPLFERARQRKPDSPQPEQPPPAKWRTVPERPAGVLFGLERLTARGSKKKLREGGGLLVVEGPGDVIRLSRAGLLAVALMGHEASPEQLRMLQELAKEYADSRLQLMLDLDVGGRQAMRELMYQVLLHTRSFLRVAWNSKTLGGRFAGKKPSQLSDEEVAVWREQLGPP